MSFDPENFLHMEIEDSNATEIVPPDEGVYEAIVDNINARQFTNKNEEISTVLEIDWELMDPDGSQQEKTGRDKITARQGIFLDLTEDGRIDTSEGRNVQLGRLREALGMNEGRFSFADLKGQQAKVLVQHRTTDNGTFPDVKKVASMSEDLK